MRLECKPRDPLFYNRQAACRQEAGHIRTELPFSLVISNYQRRYGTMCARIKLKDGLDSRRVIRRIQNSLIIADLSRARHKMVIRFIFEEKQVHLQRLGNRVYIEQYT